jgi:DNA-binding CsgD family transcriptional regulator/tetratricopeptide (TPR) repeat protein
MAAELGGHPAECSKLLVQAHQDYLGQDDARGAARCAIWLVFRLAFAREYAQAAGWQARARRLLEDQPDCVEQGFLLLPDGIRYAREGNARPAIEIFQQSAAIGRRFGDRDLIAMSLNGHGRALIILGDIETGVVLLDEAMVAVTAGEVSPLFAGTVYCSVIESCHDTLDLRRAHEWTMALTEWCESQPELLPFRGACLLHRAEVMQLRGQWEAALEEASRCLAPPPQESLLGAAYYRAGELQRLRGEFQVADDSYRKASERGHSPQPGLALLRLAQGQTEAAFAAIRGAASESHRPTERALILAALAEIALEAGDLAAARTAADELAQIAQKHGACFLRALSAGATGTVENAMPLLRESWRAWCELEVPYEAARVRVWIALACREQGDQDTCRLELEAARKVFAELGATPDLKRVDTLLGNRGGGDSPLSTREVEVLKCIASGGTNREIAATLGISEKTVARHISNIFLKLDLTSRAAATAYAFRNGLA